jgi:GTP-sensing pleiotropic transcriptional regulator CodY
MQTRVSNLIDLKKVVQQLEKDLGLGSMASHEKAVLLAISDLQQLDGVAKTKAILDHELTTSISRPSIFRALKKLEEHGKLKRSGGSNGSYLTV